MVVGDSSFFFLLLLLSSYPKVLGSSNLVLVLLLYPIIYSLHLSVNLSIGESSADTTSVPRALPLLYLSLQIHRLKVDHFEVGFIFEHQHKSFSFCYFILDIQRCESMLLLWNYFIYYVVQK